MEGEARGDGDGAGHTGLTSGTLVQQTTEPDADAATIEAVPDR